MGTLRLANDPSETENLIDAEPEQFELLLKGGEKINGNMARTSLQVILSVWL